MIEDEGDFKCDVCGVKRKTRTFLNAHKSSKHGKNFEELQNESFGIKTKDVNFLRLVSRKVFAGENYYI